MILKNTKIYKKYCQISYKIWEKNYRKKLKNKAIEKGNNLKNCIYKLSDENVKFYLPLYETDLIQQTILVNDNYYESELLDYFLFKWENGILSKKLENSAFCDIGSNIGNHSLFFLKKGKAKKGYIFEPINSTFNTMKKNIEINKLINNTELFNLGISNKECMASINQYDETNTGGTSLKNDKSGDLKLISLDSLNLKDNIILFKIDVEGFEKDVIDGALKTIKKYKPYIMIEIQEQNFDYINDKLSKIGYSVEKYDNENCLFYIKNED